ncbi:MAG: hypothetical protein M1829_005465 [Trizodia sp. TS-e1964]|nr:MAG: hypothetical protein M1829_005465 [Trizodia sp. TS-e1964]
MANPYGFYIIRNAVNMDVILRAQFGATFNYRSTLTRVNSSSSGDARDVVANFISNPSNFSGFRDLDPSFTAPIFDDFAPTQRAHRARDTTLSGNSIYTDKMGYIFVGAALTRLRSCDSFTFIGRPGSPISSGLIRYEFDLNPGDAVVWLGGVAREYSLSQTGSHLQFAFRA